MITRPGPGTARGAGAHDGAARACAARATTRSRSRRCRAPTSPASTAWSPISSTIRRARAASASPSRACASTRSASAIATEIQKVRRTGLTFAPEAGSWRLRQVINKLIVGRRSLHRRRRRVLAGLAAGEAVLPHRPADRDGRRHARYRRAREERRRDRSAVTPSRRVAPCRSVASCPKPHTPFQWFGQNGVDELRRKITLLRDAMRGTKAQVKWHDPPATFAEGIASPRRPPDRARHRAGVAGGRHVPGVERALRARPLARRDAAEGLDADWYVTRHRTEDEILPWDHITAGLHKDFLWQDWQAALAEHGLPDCRWTPCYDCGVCTDYALEHVVASPVPPAGGSPGHGPGPQPAAASRRCGSSGIEAGGGGPA